MSNPLLRPNDPRFQRAPLRDAAGNNVFADPDAPVPAAAADGAPLPARVVEPTADDVFASPTALDAGQPSYQPIYETTHPHRGTLLLVLALLGLAGNGPFLLLLAGTSFGLLGLLAIVPAATAFLLARADLAALRQGAIDPAGRSKTALAWGVGLAATAIYAAALAAIGLSIYFEMLVLVQDG